MLFGDGLIEKYITPSNNRARFGGYIWSLTFTIMNHTVKVVKSNIKKEIFPVLSTIAFGVKQKPSSKATL